MRAADEILQRLAIDGDATGREKLVQAYTPLVYSVCRRFLHRPQDVEDAAQETFLKLTRHVDRIEGSLTAWIAACAFSTSVDLIRRTIREQHRSQERARLSSRETPHHVLHQQIGEKLLQALGELDEPKRELVFERLIRKTPMRILAGQYGLTVSGISRRLTAVLGELAASLNDMGVTWVDEVTLAEHFGDPWRLEQISSQDPLRFAPDWRVGELMYADALAPASACLPGWTRPVRIGVLISYRSTIAVGSNGPWPADLQLLSTRWIPREGFELVSVIEPDSAERGPVERAMREYELIGGLIDGSDVEALKTLDVIYLGWNISMSASVARGLHDAVRSGVGLINEFWTGQCESHDYPQMRALMLSGSSIHAHHTLPHGQHAPGHVIRKHPLLPGMRPGMAMPANGCSPVYKPADGATVLAVSDAVFDENEHGIAGLGAIPMPLCVIGSLGAGRVWVMNTFPHERLAPHLSVPFSQYLRDLLLWLAEPRRE